jgi:hypothetical protein
MKIRLDNDEFTQLSFIPQCGADEMLIAALLRVWHKGGFIFINYKDKTNEFALEYEVTHPHGSFESPEINEYIKVLELDK